MGFADFVVFRAGAPQDVHTLHMAMVHLSALGSVENECHPRAVSCVWLVISAVLKLLAVLVLSVLLARPASMVRHNLASVLQVCAAGTLRATSEEGQRFGNLSRDRRIVESRVVHTSAHDEEHGWGPSASWRVSVRHHSEQLLRLSRASTPAFALSSGIEVIALCATVSVWKCRFVRRL